jgi:FkbM family methyltransferase
MKSIIIFLNFFFHIIYLFHKNRIINYLNKKLKAKIIFDVGAYRANFGHSFKESKVFFFEPNIFSFNRIKKIKKNKYFNFGLGSKYKKKYLYILPNDSASTFYKIKNISKMRNIFFNFLNQRVVKRYVVIYSLNFFIKKYSIKKIDLLKIDTEGYEEEVLKGITKNNFLKIRYIVIEKQLGKNLYKDYSFKRIKHRLKKNNFIFLKKFKDPIWNYEDQIYKNKNFNKDY